MKKKAAYLLILITITFSIFPLFITQINAQTEPTVSLTPPQTIATQLNQIITVNITVSNVQNLWGWDASITWDPTCLNMSSTPVEENFLTQIGSTVFIPTTPGKGLLPDISDTLNTIKGSASGNGVLASLQFTVIGPCSATPITLNNIVLESPTNISTGVAPEIPTTSTSAVATVSLSIGGAPVANSGQNQTVVPGTNVVFNATNSISTGDNPTYTWSFTDNGSVQTLSGAIANYTFNNVGTYIVTLTLQDSKGSDNDTVTINVLTIANPVAQITVQGLASGQSANINQQLSFGANGSYVPGNGTIAYYIWDFGDGQRNNVTQSSGILHPYSSAGNYTVTLTVYATNGKDGTASTSINVVGNGTGSTSNPGSTPDTSSNPGSTTPGTSDAGGSSSNQQPFTLPGSILAILILVTILVLVGSTFWLRKRT